MKIQGGLVVEEIVRIIRVDTKNSDKSIKDLRSEIKRLKSELDKAVVGSEEFESTLKQLTQVQKDYNSIQQQVRDMSKTNQQSMVRMATFAKNLGKSYSALNAAIGLFADGNKDIQKAMLKVQRTIQLIQGLDGITGLIRDIPKVANAFKSWLNSLDPVERQVDRIAKGINGIDPKKLQSINEANKNAAKVPQTTTTATAAGGGKQPLTAIKESEIKDQTRILAANGKAAENAGAQFAKLNTALSNYTSILEEYNDVDLNAGLTDAQRAEQLKELNKKISESEEALKNEMQTIDWTNASRKEALEILRKQREMLELEISGIDDITAKQSLWYKSTEKQINLLKEQENELSLTTKTMKSLGSTIKSAFSFLWFNLLVAAIAAAGIALVKYIKNIQSAAKEQKKFNKEVSELTNKTAAKSIVVLKELSFAYQKLGDDAKAKEKFLKDYADKIKETGIAVTDVKKAEDVFINNTDNYVNAIMARAKAQAVEQKAIEIYQEYLDKRYDMEQKLAQAGKDIMQGVEMDYTKPMGAGMNTAYDEELIRKRFENIRNEMTQLDDETQKRLRKMFEDVAITTTSGGDKAAEEFDKISEKIQQLIEYYKQAEEILNDPNYELEEKYAQELDWTRKYYESRIALAKGDAEEIARLEAERDKKLTDIRNRFENETLHNNYLKDVQEIEKRYAAEIDLAKEYNQDTLQLEEARERELAALRRKYNDDVLKSEEDRINNEINILQTQIERIRKMNDTSNLKEPKEQKYQTVYRQPVITTALGIGAGWKNVYQSGKDVKAQYEAQIEYNNKLYELTKNRIEQENELLKQQLQIEGLSADQRLEIERTLTENQIALSDARQQNEEANLQAYLDAQEKRRQALNGVLDVTSSVAGALANMARLEAQNAEEGSKKQKNATKAYKALAITQAIVDTYKGANEAYTAMASIPYVGPALGIAAATAAIISGIANVKAIQSEKISSSTQAVSGSSVQAPAAMQTPPIEYTRELVGDKELDKINEPIKCYVLEQDVTRVQNKVKVTETNASF